MAKKKKQTKQEKAAKSKAQAKRLTASKIMDAYTLLGPVAHDINDVGDRFEDIPAKMGETFTGFNMKTGNFNLGRAGRTYAGSGMNKIERTGYKFLGITRPATKTNGNYNIGDALDYLSYYGAAAFRAYEARDNLARANNEFYVGMFGINLNHDGFESLQPERMIFEKNIPYILQRKVRQLPFVKKAFAKINKSFGGIF